MTTDRAASSTELAMHAASDAASSYTDAASPGLATSLASTALALCFVLALAWVVLRLIKRLQSGKASSGGDDAPHILRSVPLGQRERLVTVRYRGREYLLGVAAGAVSVIDNLPGDAEHPRGRAAPSP